MDINILHKMIVCVPQMKDMHSGLEKHEGEKMTFWVDCTFKCYVSSTCLTDRGSSWTEELVRMDRYFVLALQNAYVSSW